MRCAQHFVNKDVYHSLISDAGIFYVIYVSNNNGSPKKSVNICT